MEKLLLTYSFLFFFILSPKERVPPTPHALYLGAIHLSHYETESYSKLTVRVFVDDLQNALKNAFQLEELPVLEELCEFETANVQQYFRDHLLLQTNKQPVTLLLEECEQLNEVVTLSFQVLTPPTWNTLTVQADFFMELFPTQSNVFQGNYYTGIVGKDAQFFGKMSKGEESLNFEVTY